MSLPYFQKKRFLWCLLVSQIHLLSLQYSMQVNPRDIQYQLQDFPDITTPIWVAFGKSLGHHTKGFILSSMIAKLMRLKKSNNFLESIMDLEICNYLTNQSQKIMRFLFFQVTTSFSLSMESTKASSWQER